MHVEDLQIGQSDQCQDMVVAIYGCKSPEYAVYRTEKRVLVQFADASDLAATQRNALAPLNPLRGEINGLIDGWRAGSDGILPSAGKRDLKARAERYDRRSGDALIVALEGDVASARIILSGIKQDILSERTSWARLLYLLAAFVAACFFGLAAAVSTSLVKFRSPGIDLWQAGVAGGAGAFFSISVGIRSRTILADLQRTSNLMDSVLRVTIGVIGAVVLMALIDGGALPLTVSKLKLLPADGGQSNNWLAVLIAGFLAGFSERFVPDLLAKILPSNVSEEKPVVSAQKPSAPSTVAVGQGPSQKQGPAHAGVAASLSTSSQGPGSAVK